MRPKCAELQDTQLQNISCLSINCLVGYAIIFTSSGITKTALYSYIQILRTSVRKFLRNNSWASKAISLLTDQAKIFQQNLRNARFFYFFFAKQPLLNYRCTRYWQFGQASQLLPSSNFLAIFSLNDNRRNRTAATASCLI